jgi:hypothetical protein
MRKSEGERREERKEREDGVLMEFRKMRDGV